MTSLYQTLEKESESAMDWFKNNSKTANDDKFQATILSKDATEVTNKLTIYNNEIETARYVKLLEAEIDYQIKFNEHVLRVAM